MKKNLYLLLIVLLFLIPAASVSMQEANAADNIQLEITGVTSNDLPIVLLTANVYDPLGQPILGLTADNFILSGDLLNNASITDVQNITVADLPLSAVLVIDTSSSMDGPPIERAKEAALLFVDALSANDSVALVTFDSHARLIQDYTTDKDLLRSVINSLPYGGKTALYDAGLLGIETAVNAPTPRRAVIILSDGAEYGGLSNAEQQSALNAAWIRGVSVYTIGLGYGTDRTYLEQLSTGTNARFYESPTPDDLPGIYAELAALLRSQYVITLNVDVPLDGQEYNLLLQADVDGLLSNEEKAVMRAPIPVPIVMIDVTDKPIAELTTVTITVAADDDLASVSYMYDDGAATEVVKIDGAYRIDIDPVLFAPGHHTLTVNAADVDGDTDTKEATIEIAALPSEVTLSPSLAGLEISEVTTLTVEASGQTETTSVAFTLAGETTTVEEAPFSFTIDPLALQPGEQTLAVAVTNQGGVTTTVEQAFTVAAFPAEITIAGIENDTVFEGSFLPEDTINIGVDVLSSQTDVTSVTYSIDGVVIATVTEAPYSLDLSLVEDIGEGEKTLEVSVTNAGGQTTTEQITFNVVVVPTPTPTSTPEPTVDVQATSDAQAAAEAQASAEAQAELDTQATSDAQAVAEAQAELDTQATSDAQAVAEAQASAEAQAELDAQATSDTQATADAQASAEALSDNDIQATADAELVAEVQATTYAQATIDARPTINAQASEEAQARLEVDAQATTDARATIDAQPTIDAQASEEAQAELDAQATADAQASEEAQAELDAQATADAQASEEAQAELDAQATADAQASEEAQAELDAQATADAQTSEAADVLASEEVQTELDAQATADAQASEEAQAELDTQATADAQTSEAAAVLASEEAQPTATNTPRPTATEIGDVVEQSVENPPAEGGSNILPFIIGGAILLVLLLIGFARRGGKDEKITSNLNELK